MTEEDVAPPAEAPEEAVEFIDDGIREDGVGPERLRRMH